MEKKNETQFINLPGTEQMSASSMDAATVLARVYEALQEKGYNPLTQIVGYLMSGDPTYITNHQKARALIMKVERDDLVAELVENYIETRL